MHPIAEAYRQELIDSGKYSRVHRPSMYKSGKFWYIVCNCRHYTGLRYVSKRITAQLAQEMINAGMEVEDAGWFRNEK